MLTALVFFAIASMQEPPKWVETFKQDFSGPAGTAPDPNIWGRDLGGEGFGNNELESYTDGAKNSFLDGKGNLIIEARKEPTKGADGIARDYSSARLQTSKHFTQRYGKFEARMKLPKGKGVWPAFWLLGDNSGKKGWPGCGEIDILEMVGRLPNVAHGTLHGPGYSGDKGIGNRYTLPAGQSFDDFHTFSVEWDPKSIRWYCDGHKYHELTPKTIGPHDWVYDHPFFIILNFAVGGGFPGNPDETTSWPQRMTVDYVKVYKDANLKYNDADITKANADRLANRAEFKGAKTISIPGTFSTADFKEGGEGVAYHDLDSENIGGFYRPNEGVDIGESGVASPKYNVGWTKTGEWIAYDLNVTKTAAYTATLTVAAEGMGGKFHFEVDRQKVTEQIQLPDTGGWQKWKDIETRLTLPAGNHELRIVFDSENPQSGAVGNFTQIRISR